MGIWMNLATVWRRSGDRVATISQLYGDLGLGLNHQTVNLEDCH
jgi:hypothetical protein